MIPIRIASVRTDRGVRLGVVDGEKIWTIDVLNDHLPAEAKLGESAIELIARYDALKEPVAAAIKSLRERGDTRALPLAAASWAPPIPDARKLLCVAGNYADHIVEGGGKAPDAQDVLPPRVFMKPPTTTMIGSGEPVVLPRGGDYVDWELELGVVIGKKARYVSPEEAKECIFGYTIVNDISDRRFDPGPRSRSRSGDDFFDWLNGKWHDTFAPVGPVVVTADELGDPHRLRMTLEVNGEVCQDASTGQMLDDVYTLVAFFSRIMTLEPGDIIATGTPAGVGDAKGRYLRPGDVMKGTIERIGTLVNPVVAAS